MNPFGVLLLLFFRPPSEQWALDDALDKHKRPPLEAVCWAVFSGVVLFVVILDLLHSFAR